MRLLVFFTICLCTELASCGKTKTNSRPQKTVATQVQSGALYMEFSCHPGYNEDHPTAVHERCTKQIKEKTWVYAKRTACYKFCVLSAYNVLTPIQNDDGFVNKTTTESKGRKEKFGKVFPDDQKLANRLSKNIDDQCSFENENENTSKKHCADWDKFYDCVDRALKAFRKSFEAYITAKTFPLLGNM